MSEIDYNAVFGLEITGANEQDPAHPAPEKEVETPDAETSAGANETEIAEQSVEDTGKQTPEENSKFAAARRKAEQERDADIARVRAEAQKTLDDTIKSLGLENPYTGAKITTKAEYDAWKRQEAAEKKKDVAESAGMSAAEFDGFVDNLPQVQDYKRRAEEAQQREQKIVLDEQISKIGKLDPTIKSVEDLQKLPEYPQIYDMVQAFSRMKNPPDDIILRAYKAVNMDKLTEKAGNAARQAAINAANGKEHMTATSSRGAGAVPVPAEVKEMYRAFMPDMTDAEMQAHYNRNHH